MDIGIDKRGASDWARIPLLHRNPMLVATILLNILGLAMPVVILQVFERIVPTQGYETLSVLSCLLLVVFVMELILRVARARLQGEAGSAFEVELYGHIYQRMIRAKPSAFSKSGSGVHLDRVQAVATLKEHRTGQRPAIMVDILFAGIFAFGIWVISGPLVLVPLCFFALVLGLGLGLRRAHRYFLSERESIDGRRYSFFIEFLNGIRTVRSQCMEAQMLRRYEMLAGQSRLASFQLIGFAEIARSIASVLGQVSVAAMALGGGFLVINGRIGMGTLAACMLLNGRIGQPVLKLFTLWAQSESVGRAGQKIDAVMALPQTPKGRAEFDKLEGTLTLHSSVLADAEHRALGSAKLVGTYIAGDILHVSETQKGFVSAFYSTLLGERSPISGRVEIDGWCSERLASIRGPGGVVYLGDEALIFHGSIMENLTLYGRLPAHEGPLQIANALGLDETVRTMPMGYETVIGSESVHYSQGFTQLVAAARALAMRPKVLIVNNSFSALDPNRVSRVAEVLEAQCGSRLTIICGEQAEFSRIATHRLVLRTTDGVDAQGNSSWRAEDHANRSDDSWLQRGSA